ncbi:MAG: peptidylprolyl isomerase [Acidimicrobiia bacterium]|nr:peptidylprolyl isomerase [Acidimicrobiia bacterium]
MSPGRRVPGGPRVPLATPLQSGPTYHGGALCDKTRDRGHAADIGWCTPSQEHLVSKQYPSQPDLTVDLDKTYTATLSTNKGEIIVDLDVSSSPLAVNNFVFLARDGFYDGVIFHRVIPGFMVQGGDPTGTGRGGPGYQFRDEVDGSGTYSRGTVAMANAGPNTNGSQFFIMHADYGLPHQYTIFGQVTSGIEAVDAIAATPTGAADKPTSDCTIESVTITES